MIILTQLGLELTIYHTRGEHANHHITNVDLYNLIKIRSLIAPDYVST